MKFTTSISMFVCGLLVALFSTPSYSKIAAQEISDLANHIAEAAERRDIRDLMYHLSSDVIITLPKDQITRVLSTDKSGNYVERIFPLVSRYKYTRSNEKIQIDKLNYNQAILTFDLTEYFSDNDEFFSEKSREEWRFKRVQGKLQVYKVVVKYEF